MLEFHEALPFLSFIQLIFIQVLKIQQGLFSALDFHLKYLLRKTFPETIHLSYTLYLHISRYYYCYYTDYYIKLHHMYFFYLVFFSLLGCKSLNYKMCHRSIKYSNIEQLTIGKEKNFNILIKLKYLYATITR